MKLAVLLALLTVACRAEQMTQEDQEVLAAVASDDAENGKDDVEKDDEPHRPAIHIPSIPSFQIIPQVPKAKGRRVFLEDIENYFELSNLEAFAQFFSYAV